MAFFGPGHIPLERPVKGSLLPAAKQYCLLEWSAHSSGARGKRSSDSSLVTRSRPRRPSRRRRAVETSEP